MSVAKKFIRHQMKNYREENRLLPMIIKIHVISLKKEYVDHYTKRFTPAVLSTICAVDIHKLSRHQGEKEVLLRGPFMLILDFFEDEHITLLNKTCSILEVVMLNANRDHISTSSLGDLDALARDTFSAMVTVSRSEFAVGYYREKGMKQEEEAYRYILEETKAKLEYFMKQ